MRSQCKLTVLLVTLLVILADAVPVSLNADQRIVSKMDSYNDISSRSLTVENHASTTKKRLLRSHTAPHAAEGTTIGEERVINIPGLSKFADAAEKMSSKSSGLSAVAEKMWLASGTKPNHVFKKLRLGENALELEKNPKFFQWACYTTKYIEKQPAYHREYYSYLNADDFYKNLLKTTNSEGEVARLVHSLEEVPELSALAKKVHKPRSIRGRERTWARKDDVKGLLGVTESMKKSDPRYVAFGEFEKRIELIQRHNILHGVAGAVARNDRMTDDALREILRGQ
ncbi:hypothetical protein PF005_g13853 [Phytophthora fragariae]|uniref:RxLR effector PexRD54 WY domain-containing protein n=1 Tax=Phytophthora fragariae TaxID=53985 RepID=A0A6A3XLU3_9STRA|nr:hypothetical protein PF003_g32009 [Phytophthora fragariae]KAE8935044.1 hypothetical protein PF009_g14991 [Phytophthora fragariae]KAE9104424.1 hypothetical protein PF007_g14063 [Phytophthora fragariae]KAE9141877.1 hypothetical protein PF006_g12972 [Phytophthora fragariae]KAE9204286.1 hypothetical protein PF005_g13853 [Phytophthora fragariae]